jgi:two-component system OmpR family sensor kinase
VEKLLQLARAESGAALTREPFDALPVLRLLVDEQARRSEVRGRVALDDGGRSALWLDGDLDAFGIAVQNLLDNALAHGDGEVRVGLLAEGTISVASGGPAVPAAELAGLTARFVRGRTRGPGSGLGLAIVEAIARQSGGSLTLHSPARGRPDGFEAVLALPPAAAPPDPA